LPLQTYGPARSLGVCCRLRSVGTILTPLSAQHPETAGNHQQIRQAYLSRFRNIQQRPETGVIGLWLKRRSRVRAPSVTLLIIRPF
jgi:hypothetical protein